MFEASGGKYDLKQYLEVLNYNYYKQRYALKYDKWLCESPDSPDKIFLTKND